MFQIYHIIQEYFANNDVIRLLTGEFNIQGTGNLMALPTDRALAIELGVSPHPGDLWNWYTQGISDFLQRLQQA